MGQRLNIEITNGEKTLANCYYHWSAYSVSAIELTEQIVNTFEKSKPINVDYAIELFKSTGADYPGKSRNDGLIGITPQEINETRDWEEGRVTINLKDQKINFKVYCDVNKTELKEYISDNTPIITTSFDFDNFDFEQLPDLEQLIRNNEYNVMHMTDGEYIVFIA